VRLPAVLSSDPTSRRPIQNACFLFPAVGHLGSMTALRRYGPTFRILQEVRPALGTYDGCRLRPRVADFVWRDKSQQMSLSHDRANQNAEPQFTGKTHASIDCMIGYVVVPKGEINRQSCPGKPEKNRTKKHTPDLNLAGDCAQEL
jgi:hypothetical protein